VVIAVFFREAEPSPGAERVFLSPPLFWRLIHCKLFRPAGSATMQVIPRKPTDSFDRFLSVAFLISSFFPFLTVSRPLRLISPPSPFYDAYRPPFRGPARLAFFPGASRVNTDQHTSLSDLVHLFHWCSLPWADNEISHPAGRFTSNSPFVPTLPGSPPEIEIHARGDRVPLSFPPVLFKFGLNFSLLLIKDISA